MNLHREGSLAIGTGMTFRPKRQKWTDAQRKEWADTRRKEWTAGCPADRNEPPALSLGERGMIQDCSQSFEMLSGFRRSELILQPVSNMFPQLAGVELVQSGQVNPMLRYLCRCGHLYHAKNRWGECFSSILSVIRLEFDGRPSLRVIVRPVDKQGECGT